MKKAHKNWYGISKIIFSKLSEEIKEGGEAREQAKPTASLNRKLTLQCLHYGQLHPDEPTFASELPSSQGKEENMIREVKICPKLHR